MTGGENISDKEKPHNETKFRSILNRGEIKNAERSLLRTTRKISESAVSDESIFGFESLIFQRDTGIEHRRGRYRGGFTSYRIGMGR